MGRGPYRPPSPWEEGGGDALQLSWVAAGPSRLGASSRSARPGPGSFDLSVGPAPPPPLQYQLSEWIVWSATESERMLPSSLSLFLSLSLSFLTLSRSRSCSLSRCLLAESRSFSLAVFSLSLSLALSLSLSLSLSRSRSRSLSLSLSLYQLRLAPHAPHRAAARTPAGFRRCGPAALSNSPGARGYIILYDRARTRRRLPSPTVMGHGRTLQVRRICLAHRLAVILGKPNPAGSYQVASRPGAQRHHDRESTSSPSRVAGSSTREGLSASPLSRP